MSDGTRTRDRRDHNPELYQLSYAHQAIAESSTAAIQARRGSRAPSRRLTTMVAIDARADHVGSLLRPHELMRARERHAAGELDAPAFKAIEDAAVREVVALQEQAGCPVVTDGELRRESFQSELTAAIDGFEGVSLDAWLWGDWHSDELGDKRVERPAEMAVAAPLVRRRSLAAEEFTFLRAITDRVGKVTLPSPTLFAQPVGRRSARATPIPRFDDFMADVVGVLRDEVRELARLGCRYVQLDAPALPAAGRPDLARVLRGPRLDRGALAVLRDRARQRGDRRGAGASPSASTSAAATRTAAGWSPAATTTSPRRSSAASTPTGCCSSTTTSARASFDPLSPRARRQAGRARPRDHEVAATRDRGRARGARPRRRAS